MIYGNTYDIWFVLCFWICCLDFVNVWKDCCVFCFLVFDFILCVGGTHIMVDLQSSLAFLFNGSCNCYAVFIWTLCFCFDSKYIASYYELFCCFWEFLQRRFVELGFCTQTKRTCTEAYTTESRVWCFHILKSVKYHAGNCANLHCNFIV